MSQAVAFAPRDYAEYGRIQAELLHDHLRCMACRWRPPQGVALHVHHRIPRSAGGTDRIGNLLVVCPNCHAIAHMLWKAAAFPALALEMSRRGQAEYVRLIRQARSEVPR